MLTRSFIALDISESQREGIVGLVSGLRQAGADVKWTAPENLHLTLRFLGAISDTQVHAVSAALEDVAAGFPSFPVRLKELGAFPDLKKPGVLWVGLEEGGREIKALTAALDTRLQALGFQKETHDFVPHLTLGRVRSPKNLKALVSLLSAVSFEWPELHEIRGLVFYKSTLTARGSIYEHLGKFDFKGQ